MRLFCFLLFILCISGCIKSINEPHVSVASNLYAHIDDQDKLERYRACVLLGELVLSKDTIQEVREAVDNANSNSICLYYLLAKRSGNPEDITQFIDKFPSGESQKSIWQIHTEVGFPVSFSSPYYVFLVNEASNNDKALDKLISGLPYADASYGETLTDLLANIHTISPDRVIKGLGKHGISKSEIKLIVEKSKHIARVKQK